MRSRFERPNQNGFAVGDIDVFDTGSIMHVPDSFAVFGPPLVTLLLRSSARIKRFGLVTFSNEPHSLVESECHTRFRFESDVAILAVRGSEDRIVRPILGDELQVRIGR